jgi:hypothetical protein
MGLGRPHLSHLSFRPPVWSGGGCFVVEVFKSNMSSRQPAEATFNTYYVLYEVIPRQPLSHVRASLPDTDTDTDALKISDMAELGISSGRRGASLLRESGPCHAATWSIICGDKRSS